MSFEELFTPGVRHSNEERAKEKILPAPAPIAGAPPNDPVDIGVDIPDADAMEPFGENDGTRAQRKKTD